MEPSLHKDLAVPGWHSSVITTYSVDPAFYDTYVEKRLRTFGCENNILMADAGMLKRTLVATPDAFRSAGTRYAVVPVNVLGCFHPKIHLRLGRDKARLIVASANATAAGWGKNQEVISTLDWQGRTDDGLHGAVGPLIRKAYDYLTFWLSGNVAESIDYKRRLHLRDSPWLADLEANDSPIELRDGSAVDLFCERGGDAPSMLRKLAENANDEKIKRLVVISPYWDSDLRGLAGLRAAVSDCPTFVALNPRTNTFPTDLLKKNDPLQFVSIHDDAQRQRFLHAKVIVIETNKADHALFGSANCSDNALGRWSGRARNAEVSVYRRIAAGTVLPMLGINVGDKVRRATIARPDPSTRLFEQSEALLPAGTMELTHNTITWSPPDGIDPLGAKIRIQHTDLSLSPAPAGKWSAQIPTAPRFPMIARVVFKDGRLSDPVIVHHEAALREAAPGLLDRRLRDAFERVMSGRDDLIDLALQAHLLFAPEPVQPQPTAARGSQRKRQESTPSKYATAEDFRRAVALMPATGDSGHFAVDDPGLQQLLTILLRGLRPSAETLVHNRDEDADDHALLAGDLEDDAQDMTEPEDVAQGGDQAPPATPDIRTFTEEQITRRRAKLRKTLDEFEKMLSDLAYEPSKISNRLAIQTVFMIRLLLYGCTFEHLCSNGQKVRLMKLAPTSSDDREYSFALRIARLLKMIWVGFSHHVAIADHIPITAKHTALPDDFCFFVIVSRWGIARAFLASSAGPSRDSLQQKIGITAAQLYAATAKFGPVDAEAEQRIILQLDSTLGFAEAESHVLIEHCRHFAMAASLKPEPLKTQKHSK